jgi:hypothetical protein
MKTLEQLTTRTFRSHQSSPRLGQKVVRAQLHHGATTSAINMRDMMVSGSRQVSANRICTVDGEFWDIVEAGLRAWTSADAAYDRGSFTVETQNLSTNGWTISRASHEALAQLCAALSVKYGWGRLNRSGPFSTWNVVGHREIFMFLGRSYATACPGGMDLDWIVKRGNEILDNKEEDIDMLSDSDRQLLTEARDEARGLSQRLDRIDFGDLNRDHDNIGAHITNQSDRVIAAVNKVTQREGTGSRSIFCDPEKGGDGRLVVISEDGPWARDFSYANDPWAEVEQLASRGWCQPTENAHRLNVEEFEYHIRNANRTFLSASPLPGTLTGEIKTYPRPTLAPKAP